MSKWNKLLAKICTLSKEVRFDELKKVLESYGYRLNVPGSEAATIHFASPAVLRSQSPGMSRSKEHMLQW